MSEKQRLHKMTLAADFIRRLKGLVIPIVFFAFLDTEPLVWNVLVYVIPLLVILIMLPYVADIIRYVQTSY